MRTMLTLLVLITAAPCFSQVTDSSGFVSSNLPIVFIDTHGQTILDEPKITADMGIVFNGEGIRNFVTDSMNAYRGKIGIEIRGSSSQMFPKKQYGMETRDSSGNNLNVSLLGMPSESDWILSAPYNDKSLMRDVLMYSLATSTGRYASRSKYCELVLNGQYMGVYILLEKIKRNKNRVNITKMSSADTLGDAVTGGYMIKVDKIEGDGTGGWYSAYPPYPNATKRIYYQYHYPKQEDLSPQQVTYIQTYVHDFESVMASASFADSLLGYPAIIDVGSFVDFFLLNELGKNVDGYRLSTFMSKERDSKNGRLVMGPVWDFNHAFGNCDYYKASFIGGYQLSYLLTDPSFLVNDDFQVPFYWRKLLEEAGFKSRLRLRWNTLRQSQFSESRILGLVDSLTQVLDEAQQRNFVRWPVLGQYVWPNAFVGKTYQEEIDYMKQWIRNRLAWMDGALQITSAEAVQDHGEIPVSVRLDQNFPNPFNPTSVIHYSIAAAGSVNLRVWNVLGEEMMTLVNRRELKGEHSVVVNAAALPSGVYFYRLSFVPDGGTSGPAVSPVRSMMIVR